jgi:Zn-dependent protease with chaperone function
MLKVCNNWGIHNEGLSHPLCIQDCLWWNWAYADRKEFMKKDVIKPKLALIFDISSLFLNYLIPILYSIAWLKFGWAQYIANLANHYHPQNLFIQMMEFIAFFFLLYMFLWIVINVIKAFFYWATGLRKNMFGSLRLELARVIYLIPGLRKKVKVTPLSEYDSSLYDRLIEWAKLHGNDIKDIQVLHTKHYSQETNAFFLGIGSISEIILVDTLFDLYSSSEIEAIVAHEFGHKHDLISTWSTVLLRVLGAVLILAWGVWHVIISGTTSSIPFTVLLIIVYWFFTLLFDNVTSKYREILADTYAVLHIPNGEDFKSVIRKLAVENYEMMSPPGIIEFLFYSHPSSAKRLANTDSLIKARVNVSRYN